MPRSVLRPERYRCPVCERWYGEHMNTGHLARHKELGGDGYTLCKGSLASLHGLPRRQGETPLPARTVTPYTQAVLFHLAP